MRFKALRILYLTTARVISCLPWRLINILATILSLLWYYAIPVRKNLIIENLTNAFPEKLKSEIRRIARANLKHYVLLLLENLQLRFSSEEKYSNKIAAIRNPKPVAYALWDNSGAIFLSAHLGNFEMLGPISYFLGFPRTKIIVKPLRDEASESLIQEIRGRWVDVILAKNGLSAALKAIRNNQMVGVMLDQHAGGRNSVWVDFFGRKAGTMKLLAILADRTNAPVIPAYSYRLRDGRLVMNFDPPLRYERIGSYDENIRHNTSIYTKKIEGWVRRHPEQWFWIHRRWKEQPTRHCEEGRGPDEANSEIASASPRNDVERSEESPKCIDQPSSSSSLHPARQSHPETNNLFHQPLINK